MAKSLFTIRKKKREFHPQIIVGSNKTKFKSVKLTHSKGKRGSRNLPFPDNPNPSDKTQSYFGKRFIEDFKFNYSKAFKNYKLTDEDIEEIIKFLRSKQK